MSGRIREIGTDPKIQKATQHPLSGFIVVEVPIAIGMNLFRNQKSYNMKKSLKLFALDFLLYA